jgi:hypothetical protein
VTLTVDELADDLGVTPSEIRVLMAQYRGDVPMWDEPGALAPEVGHDVSHMLSPYGQRHMSERAEVGD